MGKHTPEPWAALTGGILADRTIASGRIYIAQFDREDDLVRARACVNGCAGIDNPAGIPGFVDLLRDIAAADQQWAPEAAYALASAGIDYDLADLAAIAKAEGIVI